MAAAASGVQTPLLEAQNGFDEGCPGCVLERRKIAAKGAPKKELTFVAIMVLCNALPISSLFPFIYFMVRDFGIAKTTTRIASYAGYIGSALMFGRFLTSTFWGMFADRYGRKPVMVIGTATIVVFNTMFGFSTNFWMALISRFLIGFFNGMLGSVRAYASEICNLEYQALGLSMVGTMWGLGLIIGPAIGGYLAQPADKYPSLFPSGSLFDRFPYALPCLCISAFAFVGLILSFWLPESLHKHKVVSKSSNGKPEGISVSKNNGIDTKEGKDYAVVISKEEAQPVLSVPLVAIYPLIARLSGISLWIVLISAAIVKNVLSVCIVTGSFLLINNSVVVNQRGFANGVSMSFMSLFKTIGPACAGLLFSWAQERVDASFLPGMWSIFVILDVVVVITAICTFEPILPKSLLNPVQEGDMLESETKEKLQRSSSFTFD